MITKTKLLCWIGRAEGTSLLVLLFIAMPIKYLLGHPELVRIIGGLHGILFLLYIALATMTAQEKRWSKHQFFICAVLSCLPFGTFYFERRYLSMK